MTGFAGSLVYGSFHVGLIHYEFLQFFSHSIIWTFGHRLIYISFLFLLILKSEIFKALHIFMWFIPCMYFSLVESLCTSCCCSLNFILLYLNMQVIATVMALVSDRRQSYESINCVKIHLNNFVGVSRRFDLIGTVCGCLIYDDYAHHPTEVRAVLQAARQRFPLKALLVVFQPHTYRS